MRTNNVFLQYFSPLLLLLLLLLLPPTFSQPQYPLHSTPPPLHYVFLFLSSLEGVAFEMSLRDVMTAGTLPGGHARKKVSLPVRRRVALPAEVVVPGSTPTTPGAGVPLQPIPTSPLSCPAVPGFEPDSPQLSPRHNVDCVTPPEARALPPKIPLLPIHAKSHSDELSALFPMVTLEDVPLEEDTPRGSSRGSRSPQSLPRRSPPRGTPPRGGRESLAPPSPRMIWICFEK